MVSSEMWCLLRCVVFCDVLSSEMVSWEMVSSEMLSWEMVSSEMVSSEMVSPEMCCLLRCGVF